MHINLRTHCVNHRAKPQRQSVKHEFKCCGNYRKYFKASNEPLCSNNQSEVRKYSKDTTKNLWRLLDPSFSNFFLMSITTSAYPSAVFKFLTHSWLTDSVFHFFKAILTIICFMARILQGIQNFCPQGHMKNSRKSFSYTFFLCLNSWKKFFKFLLFKM